MNRSKYNQRNQRAKPRNLLKVPHSQYEKKESARPYWREVIRTLELSVKDDKFWEINRKEIKNALPRIIYNRIEKFYGLDSDDPLYRVRSEDSSMPSSGFYYRYHVGKVYSQESMQVSAPQVDEKLKTQLNAASKLSKSPSKHSPKGSRSTMSSRSKSARSFGSRSSRISSYSKSSGSSSDTEETSEDAGTFSDTTASTRDDMIVNIGDVAKKKYRRKHNPHYDLFKTNKPLRDIISWNSKLKPSQFKISESDAFEIQVEMISKKIAQDFFDWYQNIGSAEYVSEIKRPEDIESLFQVWFDEQASRSIVLDPKILPCVLKIIAEAVKEPKRACTKEIMRQVNWDINAEKAPKTLTAFNSSLPHYLKHIPPKNNTEALWKCLKIPQDLKTMECVFKGITHLTSTKNFQKWLRRRPYLTMPEIFVEADRAKKKKLFVIPSDFIMRGPDEDEEDLSIPQSTVHLNVGEVIENLMNE